MKSIRLVLSSLILLYGVTGFANDLTTNPNVKNDQINQNVKGKQSKELAKDQTIPLKIVKTEINKLSKNPDQILIAECDMNEVAMSYHQKLIVIGFSDNDVKFYNKNKQLSPGAVLKIKSATESLTGIKSTQEQLVASNVNVDDEDGI